MKYLSLFTLAIASAAVSRAQVTLTDDFNTSHNYLGAGVSGTIWSGILNSSAPSAANANTSNAGTLTITSSGVGWDFDHNGGFFLYINVPSASDFTVRVQISGNPSTIEYNDGGLMVRAPVTLGALANEDWVAGRYFSFDNAENILRSNDNASRVDNHVGVNGQKFLELTRVGNTFNFLTGTSFGSLTQISSVTRTDIDAFSTLQVGLWQGTFVGNSGTFQFDNFAITAAFAIPEPSTYGMVGGIAALAFALLRRHRTIRPTQPKVG